MDALRARLTEKLAEKAKLQAQTIEVQAHITALTLKINAAVKEEVAEKTSRKKKRAASSSSTDSSDSESEPRALEDATAQEAVAESAVVGGDVLALVPVPVAALPVPVPAAALPAPVPVAALPAPVPVRNGRGRPSVRPEGPHCPRCWNLRNKKAGGKHSRDEWCDNLTQWP